eukprot:gene9862-biopygen15280
MVLPYLSLHVWYTEYRMPNAKYQIYHSPTTPLPIPLPPRAGRAVRCTSAPRRPRRRRLREKVCRFSRGGGGGGSDGGGGGGASPFAAAVQRPSAGAAVQRALRQQDELGL